MRDSQLSSSRLSKHHVDSPCSSPDVSITTKELPLAVTTKSSETQASNRELRLLESNRELLKYKAEFQKIEEEKRRDNEVKKSLHNKQVLDKYAAKRAKVHHAVRKNNKTEHDDCTSETSESDVEIESMAPASDNNQIWEVAPDLSKPHEEIGLDVEDDEDADEMVKILNHRKKTGGPPEMLVEFENGERLWATVENAFTDGGLIVLAYITENILLDSVFEPKRMKRGKKDKSVTDAQREQTKCSTEGKTAEDHVEQMKCSHDDFRSEIGGYRAEGDSRYFVSNYNLDECFCALCQAKFVSVGTTTKKELFRPSISKPAYMCANRLHGCTHAVCYDCFVIKGMSNPNMKRCRSTRGTINSN